MFDCCEHRPVKTFKLSEAEDDLSLCCGRQHIIFRHTENSVEDVDLDIWSQRCQSLEMLSKFFLAAPSHVRDE
jgi:hypothetical protein